MTTLRSQFRRERTPPRRLNPVAVACVKCGESVPLSVAAASGGLCDQCNIACAADPFIQPHVFVPLAPKSNRCRSCGGWADAGYHQDDAPELIVPQKQHPRGYVVQWPGNRSQS